MKNLIPVTLCEHQIGASGTDRQLEHMASILRDWGWKIKIGGSDGPRSNPYMASDEWRLALAQSHLMANATGNTFEALVEADWDLLSGNRMPIEAGSSDAVDHEQASAPSNPSGLKAAKVKEIYVGQQMFGPSCTTSLLIDVSIALENRGWKVRDVSPDYQIAKPDLPDEEWRAVFGVLRADLITKRREGTFEELKKGMKGVCLLMVVVVGGTVLVALLLHLLELVGLSN